MAQSPFNFVNGTANVVRQSRPIDFSAIQKQSPAAASSPFQSPTQPSFWSNRQPPQQPTTPVKKVTYGDTGNVSSVEHHKPDTAPAQPPTPTPGLVNPNMAMQTPGGMNQTPVQTPAQTVQQQQSGQEQATFPGTVQGLVGLAPSAQQLGQKAMGIGDDLGSRLEQLRQEAARQTQTYTTGGALVPIGLGRAQAVAQGEAAQEGALTAGAAARMEGIKQALAGTEEARSALGTAAGVQKPELSQFGRTFYDPTTGQPVQQAGGGQFGTGPFAGGVASGEEASGQTYVSMKAAHTAAQGIQARIAQTLSQNPDLNSARLVPANALQQWVQGKVIGDARTQTLLNQMTEYVNTLAQVIGIGGQPTDAKAFIAQSMLNAQASGQDINSVLNSIDAMAAGKINDFARGAQSGVEPVQPQKTTVPTQSEREKKGRETITRESRGFGTGFRGF